MKRIAVLAVALAVLLSVGCQQQPVDKPQAEATESPEATPDPTPVVTPTPVPEETEEPYVFPYESRLIEAKDKNNDVVGYICIPGTNIDYPILYGRDWWFYADHDINMEKNGVGSVYSHFNMSSYEFFNTQQNLVIAAANARTSRTLFHELHHIQEVNLGKTHCAYKQCNAELDPAVLPDFSKPEGRTWDIAICGIEAQWEIWAMYEAGGDKGQVNYNTWYPKKNEKTGIMEYVPADEEDVQKWIDTQLKNSQYDFGIEVTTEDQFLTIYTSGDEHDPTDDSARLYFFLKQVNPPSERFRKQSGNAGEAAETPVPEAETTTAPTE